MWIKSLAAVIKFWCAVFLLYSSVYSSVLLNSSEFHFDFIMSYLKVCFVIF